ncbi:hypothetical protein PG984_011307 [Apiospora sp. TS-2023a]
MPKADETPFLAKEEQDIEAAQKRLEPKHHFNRIFSRALEYWHWLMIEALLGQPKYVSHSLPLLLMSGSLSDLTPATTAGILPVLRASREIVQPFFRPDHIFPNGSYFPRYSDYVGPASHDLDSLWEELDPPNLMSLDATELGDFASQAMRNPLDSNKYVTSLQVFHQLHCLRAIQKAVYSESYGKPENMLHIGK